MRSSIRRGMLMRLVPVLFLLWCGSAALNYVLISNLSREAFDRELINAADSVVGRLRVVGGRLSLDMPPAALAILKNDDSEKLYYRVVDSNGSHLAGDKELPPPAMSNLRLDVPELESRVLNGEEVRLVQIKVVPEETNYPPVVVQVAEATYSRAAFRSKLLFVIAGLHLLIIVVGIVAILYSVNHALHSMMVLQAEIKKRSPQDLSPMTDELTPEEAYPLVLAINKLFERLGAEVDRQKRFISNAAHQLRTPLAGLKTYSSIGVQMTDVDDLKHVMKQLDFGLDRASRLVNQLLTLARTEEKMWQERGEGHIVDLTSLVKSVNSELGSLANKKEITVHLHDQSISSPVFGDETGLRIMIFNLLENAILYTPAGGNIWIRLRNDSTYSTDGHAVGSAQIVEFIVEDTGGGIPEPERRKVFERFYRLDDSGSPGTGLGLAIVKEVVNSHKGTVEITSRAADCGTGTRFVIRLPRAETEIAIDASSGELISN